MDAALLAHEATITESQASASLLGLTSMSKRTSHIVAERLLYVLEGKCTRCRAARPYFALARAEVHNEYNYKDHAQDEKPVYSY